MSRKEKDGYQSDCESGEACPNLSTTCLKTGCKVYGVLDQLGWEACTKFECYEAGPVVKSAFERIGVSWREANELDKNSLFAFFRLTKFVFNILARTSDQYVAQKMTTRAEQGLDKAFKILLLNPLGDDESMYEIFLIECPEFLLLPEPKEELLEWSSKEAESVCAIAAE